MSALLHSLARLGALIVLLLGSGILPASARGQDPARAQTISQLGELREALRRPLFQETAPLAARTLELGWGRLEIADGTLRRLPVELDGRRYWLERFDGHGRLFYSATDSLEQRVLDEVLDEPRRGHKVRELEWFHEQDRGFLPELDWAPLSGIFHKLFGRERIRLIQCSLPDVLCESWLAGEGTASLRWTLFRDLDLLLLEELKQDEAARATAYRPQQRMHPLYRPLAILKGDRGPLAASELPTSPARAPFRLDSLRVDVSQPRPSELFWSAELVFRATGPCETLWCRLDPAVSLDSLLLPDLAPELYRPDQSEDIPLLFIALPKPLQKNELFRITLQGNAPQRLAQERIGVEYYRPGRAWHPCPLPQQPLMSYYELSHSGIESLAPLPDGSAPPTRQSWSSLPGARLPLLPIHEGVIQPVDSTLSLLPGRDLNPAVFRSGDMGSSTRAFTPENLLDRERDWRPGNPAHPQEREAQQRYLLEEGLSDQTNLAEELEQDVARYERRLLPEGLPGLRQSLVELLGPEPQPLRLRVERYPVGPARQIHWRTLRGRATPPSLSITPSETGAEDSGVLAQSRALARSWWNEGLGWAPETPDWLPEGLALHSALLALEESQGVAWCNERRREGLERAEHVERFYTGGKLMAPGLGGRCGGLWQDGVLREHNAWRLAMALENIRNGLRLGGDMSDEEFRGFYRDLAHPEPGIVYGWAPFLQRVRGTLGGKAAWQLLAWMQEERLPRLELRAQKQEGEELLVLRTRHLAGPLRIDLPVYLELEGSEELSLLRITQEEQIFRLEIPASSLRAMQAAPWFSLIVED